MNEQDVCIDLVAIKIRHTKRYTEYDTEVCLFGKAALVYPRSSISDYDLILCNSVGVIDPGYNNTIKLRFKRLYPLFFYKLFPNIFKMYKIGDRIGQYRILYEIENAKDRTINGRDGFGSTN